MTDIRPKRAIAPMLIPMALVMLGAGSHGSDAPQPIDACALLTRDEVVAALGTNVGQGERHDIGLTKGGSALAVDTYSSTCLWHADVAGAQQPEARTVLRGTSYAMISAMQWPLGSGEAKGFLQTFRDAARDGIIGQSPVALAIGEGALWWGDGVAVYKGDRSFGVSVQLTGRRDSQRAAEEALARTAATRL